MDTERFDDLVRFLAIPSVCSSRRRLLAAVLSGGLLGVVLARDAPAKRKRKKKKKRTPPPPVVVVSPPTACIPSCGARVCGPNSCGEGSCGECGDCKSCEGGACFPKTNGTACQGSCRTCQDGACVAKANGLPCGTGGFCVAGECCGSADRVCGTVCCAAGTLCADPAHTRCAPACDAACDDRRPTCGCAQTFDTEIDFCNVQPANNCNQPECETQEDCAPGGFCANVSCNAVLGTRCLESCPG
jgi:hypothetical protein